jgi:hypothetical protein
MHCQLFTTGILWHINLEWILWRVWNYNHQVALSGHGAGDRVAISHSQVECAR